MNRLSPERQQQINEIFARLSAYEPEQVILFGSFARNESDEISDIDLLIIKETEEDFFSRIRRVMQILDLHTAVDILVYTPAEFQAMKQQGNVLIEAILEEGIVLNDWTGS